MKNRNKILTSLLIISCNSRDNQFQTETITSSDIVSSGEITNITSQIAENANNTAVTIDITSTTSENTDTENTNDNFESTETSESGLEETDTGENCECNNNEPNCHNCIRDRLVFVSSKQYQGNFAMPGLDDKCNQLALSANLLIDNKKRFSAWVSTSEINAVDRFHHSTGRYVLVNGGIVADNWNDLVDGFIKNPINIDENGSEWHSIVWTGTLPNGVGIGNTNYCNDWNSNELNDEGYFGYSTKSDGQWTYVIDGTSPTYCVEAASIYCIEFQ